MRKKRALTLLEIMIVIFLIGLIGSVIGYNMKGSLDEGKAFKSREGAAQIRDVLLLEVAKGASIDQVVSDPSAYLKRSGLMKDASKLLKDGWGESYQITAKGADIKVTSDKLQKYEATKKKLVKEADPVDEGDDGDEA